MDTSKFAVRVTRHNRQLWIVRIERWRGPNMVCVERRDTTLASALGRARADFRMKTR